MKVEMKSFGKKDKEEEVDKDESKKRKRIQVLSDSEEEEEEKEVEEKIVEPPPPQAPLLHSDSEDEEVNLHQYPFISSHPFLVLISYLCVSDYTSNTEGEDSWERGKKEESKEASGQDLCG